ncbi:MAG: hypothetical protein GY847_31955 [Proteobacteria bacterium]|nr:hypothetical protein [Pseudomonadota bacterium]
MDKHLVDRLFENNITLKTLFYYKVTSNELQSFVLDDIFACQRFQDGDLDEICDHYVSVLVSFADFASEYLHNQQLSLNYVSGLFEREIQMLCQLANTHEELYNDAFREPQTVELLLADIAAYFRIYGETNLDVLAPMIANYVRKLQLRTIRNKITGKKNIAFYCPSKSFRTHFCDIPSRLQKEGYSVLYLYGEVANDNFESHDTSFYVGRGSNSIQDLDFLDIIFIPTVLNNIPSTVTTVLIDHLSFAVFEPSKRVCSDDVTLKYTHAEQFLPYFDYVIVPSVPVMEAVLARAAFHSYTSSDNSVKLLNTIGPSSDAVEISAKIDNTKRANPLCIIPGGYPKMDHNIRRASRAHGYEKIITYAPTPNTDNLNKDHWKCHLSINLYGNQIIERLAIEFPDYQIVFKPYQLEIPEVVQKIVDAGGKYSNFSLDTSGSEYMNLYSKTALLVSDFSNTAYSFSFSTLRPVLFFSCNEDEVIQSLQSQNDRFYCDNRENVGLVASNLDELISKTRVLLDSIDDYQNRIREVRDNLVFNVEKCEDYIVNCIDDIYYGNQNSEWIYLE